MKTLTFKEFCRACWNNRATCSRTKLNADYNLHLERQLKEFATNTVCVGHDNNKESYDITEDTFSSFTQDGNKIVAEYFPHHTRSGYKEEFVLTPWVAPVRIPAVLNKY